MNPTYILPHGVPLKLANNGDQDTSYQLELPNGQRQKVEAREGDKRWHRISKFNEAGHYRLTDGAENMVHFSVLPNTLASDLRTGTPRMRMKTSDSGRVGAQKPTNVWPIYSYSYSYSSALRAGWHFRLVLTRQRDLLNVPCTAPNIKKSEAIFILCVGSIIRRFTTPTDDRQASETKHRPQHRLAR